MTETQKQLRDEYIFDHFGVQNGDWVRKTNWELINDSPVYKLKQIGLSKNKQLVVGNMQFNPGNLTRVTAEEAGQLMAEYLSLDVSEYIDGLTEETSHFRMDNGEPKVGYSEDELPKAFAKLWKLKKTSPHKPYELYRCPFCNQHHIGKRPRPETIERYQLEKLNVMEDQLKLTVPIESVQRWKRILRRMFSWL